MVKVKICGVTSLEDALEAAQAGADMLGLNFYRKSARYLEPDAARALSVALRAELGTRCPLLVGVFVNEVVGSISALMEKVGLNFAQLSGDESGEMLRELRGIAFKAIRPRTMAEAFDEAGYFLGFAPSDERIPSLLLDTHQAGMYGGTGERANSDTVKTVRALAPRLMLAGGLTPDNVGEAVNLIRPWGVDVASGVEIDGQPWRKDAAKVRAFIAAARAGAE